jgi:hypothetical protein
MSVDAMSQFSLAIRQMPYEVDPKTADALGV